MESVNRADKKGKDNVWIIWTLALIFLLGLNIFMVSEVDITGFLTIETSVSYTEELNIAVSETQTYEWKVKNPGDLRSAAVSGKLLGDGTVKVYLEKNGTRYLILDSQTLDHSQSLASITGLAVSELNISADLPDENITNATNLTNQTSLVNLTEGITFITESVNLTTNLTNETANITIPELITENITQNISTPENITLPEENMTPADVDKSINISLHYNTGTPFDLDDDGIEVNTSAIDFTIAASNFSWLVSEENLCSEWIVQPNGIDTATAVCYGSSNCCALLELVPVADTWNEPFAITIGRYGASDNNTVSSRVIYANYSLSGEVYSDIIYSNFSSLRATFIASLPENITNESVTEFNNICEETCSLQGFNDTSYSLIIEVENATLEISNITYEITTTEKIDSKLPIVTIISPEIKVYNTTTIDLNFTIDEPTTNIWYLLNNHISVPITQNTTITAPNGTNTITVIATDLAGNAGSDNVIFTVRLPENITLDNITANITINVSPQLKTLKKDYRQSENIEIEFEFIKKAELKRHGKWKDAYEAQEEGYDAYLENISVERKVAVKQAVKDKVKKDKQIKKWLTVNETITTQIVDSQGVITAFDAEIKELREGKFKLTIPKQRAFKAGLYTLKLSLTKDSITYVTEQNFTWGVLAINTNKSIFLPNEDAFIAIAVLDDQGHMVCDANVTLIINNPIGLATTLTTQNGQINISRECEIHGVTNLPDYYTNYTISGIGTYIMNLTAETINGARTITDNFTVQSAVDFDVARDGPTRIFPPVPYIMNFTINANQNYNGIINEYVPASFNITPQQGLTITTVEDTKLLTWNVKLKTDDTIRLYYEFDAPDKSPEFYLLGKLDIGTWKEARHWQISADPPAPRTNTTNLTQESSTVEDCSNGDCTIIYYSTAAQYYNGTQTVTINTSITNSTDPLYDFEVTKNVFNIFFKSTPETADTVKIIAKDSNGYDRFATYQALSLNYRNALDQIDQIAITQTVTAQVTEDKLTYPNIFVNGINQTYTTFATQLKDKITIQNSTVLPEPAQFILDQTNITLDLDFSIGLETPNANQLDIYVDNVLWDKSTTQKTQQQIDFRDSNNFTVFLLPPPIATDANGSERQLTYQLKKQGNTLLVIIKTNYTWLNNSQRAYPVTIDPTVKYPNFKIRHQITDPGLHNITLNTSKFQIKNITITNANVSARTTKLFELQNLENSNFMRLYAINLFDAEKATATINATGTRLHKCNDWNFNNKTCEGHWEKVQNLTPGEEYEITLSRNEGAAYSELGLVVINTLKSIYLPNEVANISLAVLETRGFVICDANVTLLITDPAGVVTTLTTINGEIQVSNECSAHGKTYVPDYFTNYTVNDNGTYIMNVTAVINSTLQPNVTSSFEVRNTVDFDITRTTAIRLTLFTTYDMNFTITANKNYTGNMTEIVPADFNITPQNNLTVQNFENYTLLIFNVSFESGGTYNIGYEYDAPDISPELFILGPLTIGNFTEARVWQVASDPPDKITFTTLTISNSEELADVTATIVGSTNNNGIDAEIFLKYNTAVGGGCSAATEFQSTTCSGEDALAGLGSHSVTGACSLISNTNTRIKMTCANSGTFTVTYNYEGCLGGDSDYEVETDSNMSDASAQCSTVTISSADSTPPNNTIIQPLPDSNISGNFLINATINDTSSNVDFVNLTIFNITSNATAIIPMTLSVGSVTAGSWNATINSANFPDGFYNLSVNATDAAGNVNISENLSITIDNTGANVSAVVPANNTAQSGSFLINASVNDTLTKVFNVTFRLISASGVESSWLYAELNSGTIDQGYWNTTFDSLTFADGPYNISINATDFAGNQLLTNITQFIIDNINTITATSYKDLDRDVPFAFFDNNSVTLNSTLYLSAQSDTTLATINATAFKADDYTVNISLGNFTNNSDSSYNYTTDISNWPAGVYDLVINISTTAKMPPNSTTIQIHVYNGSGVSAYNLSWQDQNNQNIRDFVLESKHLITVFNGTAENNFLLTFLYQKDTQISYNFSDISDSNATGRGELTTSQRNSSTTHYNFSLLEQGEHLASSRLNMTVTAGDAPAEISEFIDTTESDWDAGVLHNMVTEGDGADSNLTSYPNNLSGNFTSQIFDATATANFTGISISAKVPYGKEIGRSAGDNNDATTEDIFINTSELILLFHFNNETNLDNNTLFFDYSKYVNPQNPEENNATCDPVGGTCPDYNLTDKIFGTASLTFDGSDEYIDLSGTGMATAAYDNFTFSVWYKSFVTTAATDHYFYIDPTGCANPPISWGATDDAGEADKLRLFMTGTSTTAYGTSDIVDGDWHHVASTRNSATGEIRMYVDGDMELATTLSNTGTFSGGSTGPFMGENPGCPHPVDGSLDEFALWNRTLTDSEITDLYHRGAMRLNLSVRSCDDKDCDGEAFVARDINYSHATKINLSTNNRYFQYQLNYSNNASDKDGNRTIIHNVTVNYTIVSVASKFNLSVSLNSEDADYVSYARC